MWRFVKLCKHYSHAKSNFESYVFNEEIIVNVDNIELLEMLKENRSRNVTRLYV
jgi:hypothetical protein